MCTCPQQQFVSFHCTCFHWDLQRKLFDSARAKQTDRSGWGSHDQMVMESTEREIKTAIFSIDLRGWKLGDEL